MIFELKYTRFPKFDIRSIRDVTFYYMKNIKSKHPKRKSKVTISRQETWKNILLGICFEFGNRNYFLFDRISLDLIE